MKLYIFDMGGVVVHNAGLVHIIASRLGISEDDFFRGAASEPNAHTSSYNLGDTGAYMRGAIDGTRFWNNFTRRTGITIPGDPWYDYFDPVIDEGTAAIISRLKGEGFRVVCGTNTLEAHYRKHRERGDYSVFDAVYASHLMGIIKPDPAFWRCILEKENLQPEDAFFIDDLEENVRAAEKLGLGTHLFTSPEKLAKAIGS